MTIQAVFFDLDDTLHDSQHSFEQTVKKLFPEVASQLTMNALYIKFREASDLLWKDYVEGKTPLSDLRTRRVIMAMKSLDMTIDSELANLFQKQYEYNQKHLKLFPEVPGLLGALKERGLLVGMITNGPVEHQHNKITSLQLTDHIPRHLIYVSDGVGVAKPNPDIFHHVRNSVNLLPHELLYVGDSWENDIVGSSKAGWKSLWFNHRKREPETNHEPLAVIHKLTTILEYV
ncbi:HAD family hydrolase [Robertmurraya korlensis]|uniref:HAD family hydrolase n=1 Tax=Robertmurraya korlensis TaxID=519977 RepID=UPI000B195429|nr:HAD family hydrolase [Robertmurraya korlensis]